jgi:hypothetical protein
MFVCSGEWTGWAGVVSDGAAAVPVPSVPVFRAGVFFDREDAFTRLVAPLFFGCLFLAAVDLDLALLRDAPGPGMLCMSCCARAGAAVIRNMKAATIAQILVRLIDLILFTIPSRMIRKQTDGFG